MPGPTGAGLLAWGPFEPKPMSALLLPRVPGLVAFYRKARSLDSYVKTSPFKLLPDSSKETCVPHPACRLPCRRLEDFCVMVAWGGGAHHSPFELHVLSHPAVITLPTLLLLFFVRLPASPSWLSLLLSLIPVIYLLECQVLSRFGPSRIFCESSGIKPRYCLSLNNRKFTER